MEDNFESDELLKRIAQKHDDKIKNQENTDFSYTKESLDLAFAEVEKIKTILKDFVKRLNIAAPSYHVYARDNNYYICDIIFNLEIMLVQFYQEYGNMVKDSYLLFATFDGLFDYNGYADPFHPPKNKKKMRLDFSQNNDGKLGWRDRENREKFYSSEEIVDFWLNDFFKKIK